MYSVQGLVRQKVHYAATSVCTGREAALCSAWGVEETKIFGFQAFCHVFVQHLARGQEF